MNNYEKIKAMSIDEMAMLFATQIPRVCWMCTEKKNVCLREISCISGIK